MEKGLKGIWNRVSIYCMNHDEPQKMVILQNLEKIKTPFYSCCDEHCPNRLNLDDYQELVMKFINQVDEDGFIGIDYTNFKYSYKGTRHRIDAKILRYDDDKIWIGILNKTVLGIK